MKMSGSFPPFVPANGYPVPTPNYLKPTAPYPTNSWAQNAIKGTVGDYQGNNTWAPFPESARDIKPMPWFVRGNYETSKFLFGHSEISPITHTVEFGNNGVSLAVGDFINELDIGPNLKLAEVADCSATFITDSGVNLYAVQGSPTLNFGVQTTNALTVPMIFASNNTLAEPSNLPNNTQILNFDRTEVTTSVANFIGGSTSVRFYRRYVLTGNVAVFREFTFDGNGIPLTGAVTINDETVAVFINGVFSSPRPGVTWVPPLLTIDAVRFFRFVGSNLIFALYTFTRLLKLRFYSPNQLISLVRTASNQLELNLPATVNSGRYFSIQVLERDEVNLLPEAIAIRLSSSVNPMIPGSYLLNWTLMPNPVGPIRTYFPLRYLTSYADLGFSSVRTLFDVTYSECGLFEIPAATSVVFTVRNYRAPPELPDVTNGFVFPSAAVKEALLNGLEEIIMFDVDSVYRLFDLPLDRQYVAYLFGQHAAKYARILNFANTANVLQTNYINNFRNRMSDWMTSSNGTVGGPADSNQIKTETIWGGLITPADYYVAIGIPGTQANFGNSFYNDHHFHWGYLLYATYILGTIDPTFTTMFKSQLKSLLSDYVSPVDGDFIKTRHKNWYFGHSFATGLVSSVNIDQESVSEAINSYYAAYLLSKFFEVTDPSFTPFRATAEAALFSEMASYNAYWVNTEELLDTPSASIILQSSRTYAAFSAGAPTSFPSNSVYRYSIITLPLTEITPRFLNRPWATDVFTNPQDWLRVDKNLLFELTNVMIGPDGTILNPAAWSYQPRPSPYDMDLSRTPLFTTAWGIFFMQALASIGIFPKGPDAINDLNKQYEKVKNRAYGFITNNPPTIPIDENIVRLFDSLTNAFYFLYFVGGYYPLGTVRANDEDGEGEPVTPSENRLLEYQINKLPVCPPKEYIEVPTITMVVNSTPDGLNVAEVIYTIIDVVDYNTDCPYNSQYNCLPRKVPRNSSNLITTTLRYVPPEADIRPVVNSNESSLLAQCNDLNVASQYFIQYSYLRLILSKILFGDYEIKYLLRRYHDEFFERLARSRFNRFREYFTSLNLVDDTNMIFTVIGYGNVPQQGEYYFRP